MDRNDFFQRMMSEAVDEVASGKAGSWRDIKPNILILACFGMLTNHLSKKIERPLWMFSISISAGVTWYIISRVIGL